MATAAGGWTASAPGDGTRALGDRPGAPSGPLAIGGVGWTGRRKFLFLFLIPIPHHHERHLGGRLGHHQRHDPASLADAPEADLVAANVGARRQGSDRREGVRRQDREVGRLPVTRGGAGAALVVGEDRVAKPGEVASPGPTPSWRSMRYRSARATARRSGVVMAGSRAHDSLAPPSVWTGSPGLPSVRPTVPGEPPPRPSRAQVPVARRCPRCRPSHDHGRRTP